MVRRFLFAITLLCCAAFAPVAQGQNVAAKKLSPSRYRIIEGTTSPNKRLAFAYKFDDSQGIDWPHATDAQLRGESRIEDAIKCVVLSLPDKRELIEIKSNDPWHAHGDQPKVHWSKNSKMCFYWYTSSWYASYYLVLLDRKPYRISVELEKTIRAKILPYLQKSYPVFYRKHGDYNVFWSEGTTFTSNSSLALKLNFFVPKALSNTIAHLLLRLDWSPKARHAIVRVVSLKEISMSLDPEDRNSKK
ncbi:MAG: hypothetical protein ABJA67_06435 [Chthonomonadales bacterium]